MRGADACREWVARHDASGETIIVPAIIDYELRRELLRLREVNAHQRLDAFNAAQPKRFLSISAGDLHVAASLRADVRRRGMPTADVHALDVDVILAAQALNLRLPPADFVVATGNVAHLSRFVPAEEWSRI